MTSEKLIKPIADWSQTHPDILGSLLVGSYSSGKTHQNSDIDICLFTKKTEMFFSDQSWVKTFGDPKKVTTEHWGVVKTLRVFYSNHEEVEFNFADPSWASTDPIDPETFKVISKGARILYDPSGFLDRLLKSVLNQS